MTVPNHRWQTTGESLTLWLNAVYVKSQIWRGRCEGEHNCSLAWLQLYRSQCDQWLPCSFLNPRLQKSFSSWKPLEKPKVFAHLFHLNGALCSPSHTSVSTLSCYRGPWTRQGTRSIIEILVMDELEFGETSGKNFGSRLRSLTGVQKVLEGSWKGENLRLRGYIQKGLTAHFLTL